VEGEWDGERNRGVGGGGGGRGEEGVGAEGGWGVGGGGRAEWEERGLEVVCEGVLEEGRVLGLREEGEGGGSDK